MSKLFGYRIYTKNRSTLISELNERIKNNEKASIVSLNTLKLYQGSRDKNLEKLFQSGTIIIPDGQSIVFAERLVNRNKIAAISGAELMVALIKESEQRGHKLFFLGSPQSLLDKVQLKIETDYPKLRNKIAFQHGYYDEKNEDDVIIKIAEFRPDILFVAFGSPRKERFIVENQSRLNAIISMGVGGSYEYFVGDVKLDSLTKKLGIRWLVRTLQDPMRLAKRYAICNTYFLKALFKEILNKEKQVI